MMKEIMTSKDWQKASKLPDFEDIKQILFLVRDADKLANLYHIKTDNHLQKDLFYRQLSDTALNAPISPNILQQFYSKHVILFPNVYSFADRILMVISWIFDLNYQETRKIFAKEKYAEYLFDLLSKYHKNPEDITKIKNYITQFKRL